MPDFDQVRLHEPLSPSLPPMPDNALPEHVAYPINSSTECRAQTGQPHTS